MIVVDVDTNPIVYLWIDGKWTRQAEAVLERDAVWAAPVLCDRSSATR